MLDVSRLRVLRAVVATGSIRASAESLGYTSSAVSQQLSQLQRETGLHLLERVGRGVEPTAAGRVLAAEAESLFEALSRLEGIAADLRDGRVGSLSIGYFGSAGAAWLPSVVGALHTDFPELRVDMRMTEFDTGTSAVPDVDIFVEDAASRRSADVEVHRLADDPYVAVVPVGHPLADHAEIALGELAAERWIDADLSHGVCRQVLLTACAEAGFTPEFAVETHDYPTAISFATTGIGLTVLPELGLGDLPSGVTAVRLVSPTPVRHICVAVKKSVAGHPAALRILELLRAEVSRSQTVT
ncbi:LysR family transcriptional regulator [Phytoactinopolyspora alkaliphila]|uniref:LysR family transcriptional regulator n=1 Tax=Phytoactinopolyspora alkaliphila TaxID=1783498 RepID=A0A6N9YGD8_9ACTN|nr:LysR family transcriptional regulator [Phytoactinopolyspora alkaliphila]NED94063.1 LysR family transcriptional regulator [Phytoactinopolyspora alkaliphila]